MNEDFNMSKVKLLDGGLGTELSRLGYDIDNDHLWSARLLHENPIAIKQAHLNFLNAGCDVITTSSYQANVEELMLHLKVDRNTAISLLQSTVTIARDAIKECSGFHKNQLVAASIGPYGACLHDGSEYTGTYIDNTPLNKIKEWHRLRMEILAGQNPDIFAIETIPSQKEAEILIELLREFPNTKAWLSFTCKDNQTTCYNNCFRNAVKEISKCKQIIAVGVNCSKPNIVQPLIESVKDVLRDDFTFIAYPNSGEGYVEEEGIYSWQMPVDGRYDIVKLANSWLQTNKVGFIGGCCRITPDYITKLRTVVDQWNK